ncbi:MAG: TonB-dependent outer membrane protein SusC/RagA [Gemmatimonadetes bacterium]|nr:TonB-dependent outer membrane protein SusC/RagA [Gemmatimonadota bacterium]
MTTIITRMCARGLALAVLSVLLTLPAAIAQAQNAVITGKVISENGQPIEAANVYITDLASVGTNAQGVYTISIPGARVTGQKVNLRVRAIGHQSDMRPIVVTVGSHTENFTMKQDVNRLSEVVVTGVMEGTERSKVPFAVGRITSEDLPVPALDPIKALAGKVAGLRIAQTTGRPGDTPEIQLRGPTSINATGRTNGPLIIVDGAIMNINSPTELGGLDIESVEVVKGAAGASLYGSRAANGVITIRTKRGSSGAEGIKFATRSEYGFSDVNSLNYGQPVNHQLQLDETGKRFCVQGSGNVASCSRTIDWMTEILRINNVAADTTRTPVNVQGNAPGNGELVNTYQGEIWPGRSYNMLAQAVQRNPIVLNEVDATGKLGAVRFYASGSYQNEQGAIRGMKGNQQRRGRVNLDYDLRQDLTISLSSLYDNGTSDVRDGGSSNGSLFGQLLRGAAAGTDYLALDSLGRPLVRSGGGGLRSPSGNGGGTFLYNATNQYDTQQSGRFLGNMTARYVPADWVNFESTLSYDNRQRLETSYAVKGYRTFTTSSSANNGNIQFGNRGEESYNASFTGTVRKQVRSDLSAKFQVRGLFDQDNIILNGNTGQVFLVRDILQVTNTSTNQTATSSSQTIKNVGMSAGASLDFKDKYILDGTMRRDGSSLFGEGNRWANFGRISGVWRISEEPFWKLNWLNDFRIRASHGTAGSSPRFVAQYEVYNVTATGITLGQAGNSKLRPETTTENEFGADFTLFNRLGVELTKADSRTRDQIQLVNTPNSLGFSNQWQNAGTLDNHTYEVSLNLPILDKKDLSWNMHSTFDRTRTFISELFTSEYVYDGGTGQGTASFFRISANTGMNNGFQINRFGNIWGRKFYKKCSDMDPSLQGQCGDGKAFQVNDGGYVVWVGDGNSWRDGITKNLSNTVLAGAQSPFGNNVPLYFGMPIIDRPLRGQVAGTVTANGQLSPGEGTGFTQIIGNALPDFRFTFSNNISYKRFTLYGLLDATMGQDVYNQGEGWGLLDFSSSYFDQGKATVETAKPLAYGWRAGPSESTGLGGFYDTLNPNNYVLEDASFAKIREVSLTYKIGALRGVGGDWTVGLVGRNLWTFTNYSGLDPEVGANTGSTTNGSGSALLNATDAFGFPTLRTFTLSLSTRF